MYGWVVAFFWNCLTKFLLIWKKKKKTDIVELLGIQERVTHYKLCFFASNMWVEFCMIHAFSRSSIWLILCSLLFIASMHSTHCWSALSSLFFWVLPLLIFTWIISWSMYYPSFPCFKFISLELGHSFSEVCKEFPFRAWLLLALG